MPRAASCRPEIDELLGDDRAGPMKGVKATLAAI
jgi:hypothetical protein